MYHALPPAFSTLKRESNLVDHVNFTLRLLRPQFSEVEMLSHDSVTIGALEGDVERDQLHWLRFLALHDCLPLSLFGMEP
jgi:hypothetical protein